MSDTGYSAPAEAPPATVWVSLAAAVLVVYFANELRGGN
jgi:hypothetical protein